MKRDKLREEFILDQDWAKITAKWGYRQLTIFFTHLDTGDIELDEMTSGQFTRILSKMRTDGYAWSSRNGLYNVVGGFYRWLYQNGHINQNLFANPDIKPKRPRKERRVVKAVPLMYVEAILRAASVEDTQVARRNRAIVSLIVSTGMRRGEVVQLRLPDVDFQQNEILLRQTKLDHERYVFLTDDVAEILKQWLEVRPNPLDHDRVFVALHYSKQKRFRPLHPNAINKMLHKLKRDADIPKQAKLTPHMLRHTFATEVAKSGNPFALMELLGHQDIQTTKIYVHTDRETLRSVAQYAPQVKL